MVVFRKAHMEKNNGAWVDLGDAQVGMPLYDDYTKQQFEAAYGRAMQIIQADADPANYPSETAFLPTLIGGYTVAIRTR